MKGMLLLTCAAAGAIAWFGARAHDPEIVITEKVLVPNVGRFGINLGGWSFFGADQFMSNILKNPGFEGLLDGAIVIPVHPEMGQFDDSPEWLARPDGFWEGARYSIRTGTNAGRDGVIVHSSKTSGWNLPYFVAREGDPTPDAGAAVAMMKDTESEPPTQWWFSNDPGNSFAPELNQVRPGSPGVRSLRVAANGTSSAKVTSYLDSIGERSGNLLPLSGNWHLSFWTRLDKGSAALHVSFGRQGSAALLSRDVPVNGAWTNVQLAFSGTDNGPSGTVSLQFELSGRPSGELLLDDVDIRRAEDSGQPFRHEVVTMLERLHPAYLREWQGQLGDTLANRIAPQFGRKSYRYRPGDTGQTDFGYGLPDFLQLCLRVKTSPWIIIPTVFNDADCSGLGDYLRSQPELDTLPEIIVEFGNENWNSLFRPAGISDPVTHGQASGRCFAEIRAHAPGMRLKTAADAQADYPAGAVQSMNASQNADLTVLAPYFLQSLPAGLSLAERLGLLVQPNTAKMMKIAAAAAPLKRELAIYEVNLSTVDGNASAAERLPVAAGFPSGTALARTMLDLLALGIRRQCVYSLSGYDSQLSAQTGFVPLWGVSRDLGPTQRLRPTGLALELLNQTVMGDMLSVTNSNAGVSAYAFRSDQDWSAILISSLTAAQTVTLRMPTQIRDGSTVQLRTLGASTLDATNEDSDQVVIAEHTAQVKSGTVSVSLAPFTATALFAGKNTARGNFIK